LAGLLIVAGAWSAHGQQLPFNNDVQDWVQDAGDAAYNGNRSGQALGTQFRLGHVTGPAIGREESITPVEMMNYMFLGDGMLFGDIRGFAANNGKWGANLGVGYRHYVSSIDRIFGVNAYYDYDAIQGGGAIFRDVGLGFETYGKFWDARANLYTPLTEEEFEIGSGFVAGSQRYSANSLIYDGTKTTALALKGFDAEFGIPLPSRVLQDHDVRLYAGTYSRRTARVAEFSAA
jgi:hypothetical protein